MARRGSFVRAAACLCRARYIMASLRTTVCTTRTRSACTRRGISSSRRLYRVGRNASKNNAYIRQIKDRFVTRVRTGIHFNPRTNLALPVNVYHSRHSPSVLLMASKNSRGRVNHPRVFSFTMTRALNNAHRYNAHAAAFRVYTDIHKRGRRASRVSRSQVRARGV